MDARYNREQLILQATDPSTYDRDNIDWLKRGPAKSPKRKLLWGYLQPFFDKLAPKTALDVGCGTGWLGYYALSENRLLTRIVGFDPSSKNVAAALENGVSATQARIETFGTTERFDLILASLSLAHVRDLDLAYQKIASWVAEGKDVIVIEGNLDYFASPRFDYQVFSLELDDGSVVVQVERPTGYGPTTDIFRHPKQHQELALRHKLALEEIVDIKPTSKFLEEAPKYAPFADMTIFYLLHFRHVPNIS